MTAAPWTPHRSRLAWRSTGPVAEIAELWRGALAAARAGRSPWLGWSAAGLAIAATTAYTIPAARRLELAGGGVRASLPWWQEIVRLPGSAFLPTPDLPLAAAVVQLLVVFAISGLLLGSRKTAVVAAIGQVASSLAARCMIILSAVSVVGLPAAQSRVLDTGPSGMTTAVGAWLLVRTRSHWGLAVLGMTLAGCAVWQDDLDGREHLVAFVCGAAIGGLSSLVPTRKRRVERHTMSSSGTVGWSRGQPMWASISCTQAASVDSAGSDADRLGAVDVPKGGFDAGEGARSIAVRPRSARRVDGCERLTR